QGRHGRRRIHSLTESAPARPRRNSLDGLGAAGANAGRGGSCAKARTDTGAIPWNGPVGGAVGCDGGVGGTGGPLRRGVVKRKILIAVVLAVACVAGAPGAGPGDVKSVLDKFQSVRPQEEDLALYQLDWVPTLKAAREKAAREERPIFLVLVTNSFGDL